MISVSHVDPANSKWDSQSRPVRQERSAGSACGGVATTFSSSCTTRSRVQSCPKFICLCMVSQTSFCKKLVPEVSNYKVALRSRQCLNVRHRPCRGAGYPGVHPLHLIVFQLNCVAPLLNFLECVFAVCSRRSESLGIFCIYRRRIECRVEILY